jgi:predicted dehydrogenase
MPQDPIDLDALERDLAQRLPDSRVPEPGQAPALRWGVLGTGWIAERFTSALHARTGQRMVAVASRDAARAEGFARALGIERPYGSYQALVEDPAIDVVYVATPHPMHLGDATMAMRAGKHVLVEKPLALDAGQARRLAEVAGAAGVFCMEALWTLFLPRYDVVRQVVRGGLLGEVRTAILDHGEWFDAGHRILRPELAGGSLLDLATYTVAVADDLLGPGRAAGATAELAPTGVEGQVSAIVVHDSGAHSLHHSTILPDTPVRAVIAGTEAVLEMEPPFWGPGPLRVHFHDGRPDLVHDEPRVRHEALHWEAAEVARQVAAGATQSPLRPLAASVRCLELLDQFRASAGIPPARPFQEG